MFLIGCILVKKIQIFLNLCRIKKNGCCDWELNSSVPKKEIHKAKFTTRQEGPLNIGSLVEYLKSRVHAPDIAPEPVLASTVVRKMWEYLGK